MVRETIAGVMVVPRGAHDILSQGLKSSTSQIDENLRISFLYMEISCNKI